MAPSPAPWAVLGDVLWCLGLGCLLAGVRDAVRLALGEGALLLGAACWHWTVQPAVHRCAAAAAACLLAPLHAVEKTAVKPLKKRLAAARSRRRERKKAKKSEKKQKSAEKQLQKPSTILYN